MSTTEQNQFVLGDYNVSQAIGEGTFGKVRLGVHLPTGERVAVKILQKDKIIQNADLERVTRQISILKLVRHPNIVQLYQIIETKKDLYLVMEYAAGGELFDEIVKKKRLGEKDAGSVIQQILAGVEYLHKIGVVHRDLKPENLLFDDQRTIKIVDFGLSNQYEKGQRLKTACGSPCYAAPEMIAGKSYQCPKIDIWSCGIILYAMLCGCLPFEDPNTSKLYKKILTGEYQQPKLLSPEAKNVIRGILHVDPDFRYTIQRIKSSEWYNQTTDAYQAPGIVVGTDAIVADSRVIATMKKMGVTAESSQIQKYIVSNRHNRLTSFYYLLKKKAEKHPSILVPETQKDKNANFSTKNKAQKYFYLSSRKGKNSQRKDSSSKVNDSLNEQAIRSILTIEKQKEEPENTNQKKQQKRSNIMEQFKKFPKSNQTQEKVKNQIAPKETAITQKSNTSTSKNNESKASFAFDVQLYKKKQTQHSNWVNPDPQHEASSSQGSGTEEVPLIISNSNKQAQSALVSNQHQTSAIRSINTRKQELASQLKKISFKIDQELFELSQKKNVPLPSQMIPQKRRDAFGGISSFFLQCKTEKANWSENRGQQPLQIPSNINQSSYTDQNGVHEGQSTLKINDYNQLPAEAPKIHLGPFNARCLLLQPPRALILKIQEHLSRLKIIYKQLDTFTLSIQTGELITVQSIQGLPFSNLLKMTPNSFLTESILQHLQNK